MAGYGDDAGFTAQRHCAERGGLTRDGTSEGWMARVYDARCNGKFDEVAVTAAIGKNGGRIS
jgi:hypothetical protein